jgi:hypothetical protein
MANLAFAGAATRLSADDIVAEAADLRCHPAIIYAVRDVESAGAGFLSDGRPKILFEAHAFYRRTGGRFGVSNISSPKWNRSLYGAGGANQYGRLDEAMTLDRTAALESASWGMFQVMGFNCGACGYSDVETFVAAMVESERAHLDAFTKFCIANHIDDELRESPPNFEGFTAVYNGSGQVAVYSAKLRAAFRKWLANPATNPNPAPRTAPALHYSTLQLGSHGPAVLALEQRLVELGYEIETDEDFETDTAAAVWDFQEANGLVRDGIVGPNTARVLGLSLAA